MTASAQIWTKDWQVSSWSPTAPLYGSLVQAVAPLFLAAERRFDLGMRVSRLCGSAEQIGCPVEPEPRSSAGRRIADDASAPLPGDDSRDRQAAPVLVVRSARRPRPTLVDDLNACVFTGAQSRPHDERVAQLVGLAVLDGVGRRLGTPGAPDHP
jgi:hypothetical protein